MGYFSEMDIELRELEQEVKYDWQQEQFRDEQEQAEEMAAFVSSGTTTVRVSDAELNDPHNEFGNTEFDSVFGVEELRNIEAQAEIQENIHNGYWE